MNDPDQLPEADRDERPAERLDRNTIELLNELRIAGTGIQVMFAFLLVVPFQQGWSKVNSFERTVYFVTLLLVALATFLLMAPPIHHRILFRHGEKPFLIDVANRLAIAGMVCLAFGFVGILLPGIRCGRRRLGTRRGRWSGGAVHRRAVVRAAAAPPIDASTGRILERMVRFTDLLAFAGIAAIIVLIPGPSVLFTISRALTGGRRTALFNVLGNELGLVGQVIAVAFGLGAVIARSAEVFTAIKLAGAIYLVYLGVQAIRHRRSLAEAVAGRVQPSSPARAIRDGAIVGFTNPKTIAAFVVLLPQFTRAGAGRHEPPTARARADLPADRACARQPLGARRGHFRPVAVGITSASGRDRWHRRPRDDRARHQHRGDGPPGLTARRGAQR